MSRTWIRYLEILVHWFYPVGNWLQSRCQDDVSSCVARFTGTGTPCLLHQWHIEDLGLAPQLFLKIGSARFGSDFNPDAKMTCRCVCSLIHRPSNANSSKKIIGTARWELTSIQMPIEHIVLLGSQCVHIAEFRNFQFPRY
jgi:hypothetical protein